MPIHITMNYCNAIKSSCTYKMKEKKRKSHTQTPELISSQYDSTKHIAKQHTF